MYILKDQMNKTSEHIKGHLMMDEIKLKNGIMWNCMNNEVTGFVEEDLKMKDLLNNILDKKDDKKVDGKQLSVYANQWRFRSTRGITHNSNFYFNKGSLDSNEITKQSIDVLSSYELMGIQIHGIVSDGGGGNEKFFRSIVENSTPVEDWSSNKNISFINPIDVSRRIYVWSCGTHSLKAVRNNLYRSQPNLARNLRNKKVYFGWKNVERIYLRDEKG